MQVWDKLEPTQNGKKDSHTGKSAEPGDDYGEEYEYGEEEAGGRQEEYMDYDRSWSLRKMKTISNCCTGKCDKCGKCKCGKCGKFKNICVKAQVGELTNAIGNTLNAKGGDGNEGIGGAGKINIGNPSTGCNTSACKGTDITNAISNHASALGGHGNKGIGGDASVNIG